MTTLIICYKRRGGSPKFFGPYTEGTGEASVDILKLPPSPVSEYRYIVALSGSPTAEDCEWDRKAHPHAS